MLKSTDDVDVKAAVGNCFCWVLIQQAALDGFTSLKVFPPNFPFPRGFSASHRQICGGSTYIS